MASMSQEAVAEGKRLFDGQRMDALKIVAHEHHESQPYWICDSCLRPFPETVRAIIAGENGEVANCRSCIEAILERYDRGEVDPRPKTDA
jgi:hypothetical protein